MRVGVFFGGPSREREISFAGGRTVYDNLNKTLFDPVPIFVDSLKNLILLDWQYIYKGTIRDFYPPLEHLPNSENDFQVYIESLPHLDEDELVEVVSKVGRIILPQELPDYIDFAFLALHGVYGEDGQIQGLLESLNIPYSGSGIMSSAIGMNKAFQKKALRSSGLPAPEYHVVSRRTWVRNPNKQQILDEAIATVGSHIVIKPAHQGSSIGVNILQSPDLETFSKAIDAALFIKTVDAEDWNDRSHEQKVSYIRSLTDIREGLGLPVIVGCPDRPEEVFVFRPDELLKYFNDHFSRHTSPLRLQAVDAEKDVLIEAFIPGREFSCIVVRNENGEPLALPPTEILKGGEVFDYRSKYLAGLSRKVTPIDADNETLEQIRKDCVTLFNFFEFEVYARIDGFLSNDGKIYLNDPNTTSGMLPSSFFFHQAAEIGLNPSQFLTYIIRASLDERLRKDPVSIELKQLLTDLDDDLIMMRTNALEKKKIAVILGGYSSERHISVESGRNIFEKLSSSDKYDPIPIFLTGNDDHYDLYQIPVNIMLKDNADDIKEKIEHFKVHPLINTIREEASLITNKYADDSLTFAPQKISIPELAEMVDGVFIALHGRPGEDGSLQAKLEEVGLPYNGSGVESSSRTINKYETNQLLKQHGFLVADQLLVYKKDFIADADQLLGKIGSDFKFPIIAKPVDDGCSSAVKKIHTREELKAFLELLFREEEALEPNAAKLLKLKAKEEFSRKDVALIESFISSEGAKYFLEVTGGMVTHEDTGNGISYEVFEPSEALASGEVLSLEEKFLAGEGQNLTPARFGTSREEYDHIAAHVKADLGKVAQLLGVEGYCRIDAFVRVLPNNDVQTIIIEVNSLPGMTPATCIYHQAALNGYRPYDLIDQILEFAMKKEKC